MISSVLERKVWVKLFADKIYPNQYIILVAPPGLCGKGAAMGMGKRILNQIDDLTFGPDKVTLEKLIRIMANAQNTYIPENEKFPTIHSSVTLLADELEDFMTARNDELVIFLTKIWSIEHIDKYEYDTKHAGKDTVIGPWLNMLGATTPDFFNTPIMMKAVGGGFSARTAFIYSEWPRRKNLSRKAVKAMESLVEPLVEGLEKIHQMQGEFEFTEDGWNWFRDHVENEPQKIIPNAALAVFNTRIPVHMLKVAMCFSAAEDPTKRVLTRNNLKSALKTLKQVQKGMEHIFTTMGRAPSNLDCKTMLDFLSRSDEPASMKEMKAELWQDIETDKFMQTVSILLQAGKIQQIEGEDGELMYKKIGKVMREGERDA